MAWGFTLPSRCEATDPGSSDSPDNWRIHRRRWQLGTAFARVRSPRPAALACGPGQKPVNAAACTACARRHAPPDCRRFLSQVTFLPFRRGHCPVAYRWSACHFVTCDFRLEQLRTFASRTSWRACRAGRSLVTVDGERVPARIAGRPPSTVSGRALRRWWRASYLSRRHPARQRIV